MQKLHKSWLQYNIAFFVCKIGKLRVFHAFFSIEIIAILQ